MEEKYRFIQFVELGREITSRQLQLKSQSRQLKRWILLQQAHLWAALKKNGYQPATQRYLDTADKLKLIYEFLGETTGGMSITLSVRPKTHKVSAVGKRSIKKDRLYRQMQLNQALKKGINKRD